MFLIKPVSYYYYGGISNNISGICCCVHCGYATISPEFVVYVVVLITMSRGFVVKLKCDDKVKDVHASKTKKK